MLNRDGAVGPCSACHEPIARARQAALVFAVVAGVAIEAEVLHQLCARSRALTLGGRAEVILVSDLASDARARERLRLFARSAREAIARTLVKAANLGLREGLQAPAKTMLRATGSSRLRARRFGETEGGA